MKALACLQLEPAVTPVVLISSDEEIGSGDSEKWTRRLSRRSNRVFVLEPPLGKEGRLKTVRKGAGLFKVTVKGRAAHAGLEPEAGASAILELAYVIQKLAALNSPRNGMGIIYESGENMTDTRRKEGPALLKYFQLFPGITR